MVRWHIFIFMNHPSTHGTSWPVTTVGRVMEEARNRDRFKLIKGKRNNYNRRRNTKKQAGADLCQAQIKLA